jgi:FG-GAP-like repeat
MYAPLLLLAAPALAGDVDLTWKGAYDLPGQEPSSPRLADLNNDGFLDIIVGSNMGGEISILWGHGTGDLSDDEDVDNGGWLSSHVTVADVNLDGNLDILAGSDGYGGTRAQLHLGDGQGGFTLMPPLDVLHKDHVGPMAVGDFNGDGNEDVFVAHSFTWDPTLFLGNGDGTFAAPIMLDPPGSHEATDAHAADLDHDGNLDVVLAKGASASVLMGNGDGTFTLLGQFVGGIDHEFADINGDGELDFVAGRTDGVAVMLGQGDGSFALKTLVAAAIAGSLDLADLDGDGDLDVAAVLWLGAQLQVLLGDGEGMLTLGSTYPLNSPDGGSVALGDLDGDGLADVASPYRNYGQTAYVTVLLNTTQVGLGLTYCSPAVANSTGAPGVITAFGSDVAAAGDLLLVATQLPPNQFGYFLASETQGLVIGPGGSQGNLCLAGSIGRFAAQVATSGPGGRIELQVDTLNIPTTPPQGILQGSTWNFQLWHRDKNPVVTSNFTDAVSILFL